MARHWLRLARPEHRFSCAHMTVFPDGTKERLHGHNYTIAIAVELDSAALPAMLPFAPLRAAIGEVCAAWKERVLIAARNPFLVVVRQTAEEIELTLCGERYVLPRGDVLMLPIDNVSCEALAAHAAELLRDKLASPHARALEVTVEEHPGQGASCELALL